METAGQYLICSKGIHTDQEERDVLIEAVLGGRVLCPSRLGSLMLVKQRS